MKSVKQKGVRYSEKFYAKETLNVARALLGAKLTTIVKGKLTSGMIVEVEAYSQHEDEASHSFRGKTVRNSQMFEKGGAVYVYKSYGIHHCVNIVTEKIGFGSAVLIRAVEPVEGVEVMRKRRHLSRVTYALTNGPGKLTEALAITDVVNGENLMTSSKIHLSTYKRIPEEFVGRSERVGITKSTHLPWRLFIKGNPWVGRHKLA